MKDYEEEERHESYGVVSLSRRMNSGGMHLFDSPVDPLSTISVSIFEARPSFSKVGGSMRRSGRKICEIEMSATQFAEWITTPNVGSGVSCTIRYQWDGEELRRMEDPPRQTSEPQKLRDAFVEEVKERRASLGEVVTRIAKMLDQGKVGKARKAEILDELRQFGRLFDDTTPFMMERFEESVAETVQSAKTEFAAYVDHARTLLPEEQAKLIPGADELLIADGREVDGDGE
jgi:hypothetical protein